MIVSVGLSLDLPFDFDEPKINPKSHACFDLAQRCRSGSFLRQALLAWGTGIASTPTFPLEGQHTSDDFTLKRLGNGNRPDRRALREQPNDRQEGNVLVSSRGLSE
jgi:hypothetical protein